VSARTDATASARTDATVSARTTDTASATADATVSVRTAAGPAAQIRRSDRDDEDAAAVLVVLGALLCTAPTDVAAAPSSAWASPAHRLGVRSPAGAGAWWASGLPR
jgi:hypothetical protein